MSEHSGFTALGPINFNQNIIRNRGSICIVDISSSVNLTSGANTIISFNRKIYDPQNWHNNTNPSRITVPEAGVYKVEAYGRITDNSLGGIRLLGLLLNGSIFRPTGNHGLVDVVEPRSTGWARVCLNFFWYLNLNANNYLEAYVYQDSGQTLTMNYLMLAVSRV